MFHNHLTTPSNLIYATQPRLIIIKNPKYTTQFRSVPFTCLYFCISVPFTCSYVPFTCLYFYMSVPFRCLYLCKFLHFFQQGWDDVSFHGNPEIPTPNIDRIANHGVILQEYYTTPKCEDSVAALKTGKYPIHYSKWSITRTHPVVFKFFTR